MISKININQQQQQQKSDEYDRILNSTYISEEQIYKYFDLMIKRRIFVTSLLIFFF